MTPAEVEEKFRYLADPVMPTGAPAAIVDAVSQVEEIMDIDDDGYQDILVGYFLSPYMWMTSGFTLLKNYGDCFLDETEKFFPNQITNRHFKENDATAYTHNFFHGDLNGDGFKDLILQTDGVGRWSSEPHKYHPYIFLNDTAATISLP